MTTSRSGAPTGLSWRFARLTAPMVRSFAGHRFFPIWAVVHHRGRRTGRALSVPVAVLATADVFVITLPWGPGTNWACNVLAAGGCVVRWRGADHRTGAPELIGRDRARMYFGRLQWVIAQRVFGGEAFLLLHRTAAAEDGAA